MDLQLPKTWLEKLEALEVGQCEPVDNKNSAYTGIYTIYALPGNLKRFTIRTVKGKLYAFRKTDEPIIQSPLNS